MAKSLGSMVIHLGLDSKGMTTGVAQAESTLSRLRSTFGTVIAGITAAVGALATLGWASKLAAQAEDAAVSFEVMLGSVAKAQAMLKDLESFAASTPFGEMDLQSASQTLLQFGVEANDILPTLKMLGDVAGGNSQRLGSLALVFGQISAAGKLTGGDLLQLINVGFNPLKVMADQTGKSMSELRDEMSKGNITFEQVQEAFRVATSEGGLFFERMEKGSQTVSGKWSTFMDGIKKVGKELGTALAPAAKILLDALIKVASQFAKVIEAAAPLIESRATVWAESLAWWLGVIADWLVHVTNMVKATVTAMQELGDWLAKNRDQLNPLINGMADLLSWLGLLPKKAAELKDEMQDIAEEGESLAGSFNKAAESARDLADILKQGESITKSLRTPDEVYADRITELKALATAGAISLETLGRGMSEAQQTLLESIEKNIQTAKNFASQGVGATERNSVAAFSAIQSAMRQDAADKAAEAERKRQHEKTNTLLEEANRRAAERQEVVLRRGTF